MRASFLPDIHFTSEPELKGELGALLEGSEGGGAGRRRGREDDDGPSEEAGEAEAEPPAKVPRSPPHGGGSAVSYPPKSVANPSSRSMASFHWPDTAPVWVRGASKG